MATTKKRTRRKVAQPYSPTAPRFRTQREFDTAAKKRAQLQIDPLLQDVNQRQTEATGAHTTRQGEIGGWFGNEATQSKAGYDRLDSSLKSIMGGLSGMEGDSQGALSAALRQQAEAAQAEAAKLGVNAPTQDPSFLQTAQAYGGANGMGLAGDAAGLLGRSAAGIGTAGTRGREAATAEDERFNAIIKGLTGERTDIQGRLPGLLDQSITSLGQEELGREGQAFQEGLANKQFGLSVRSQAETERTGRSQRSLAAQSQGETARSNRANEGLRAREITSNEKTAASNAEIERKKLGQAIKDAKTEDQKAAATLRAQGFNNGIESIKDFITPAKWELDDLGAPTDQYKRSWREGLDVLMNQVGLGTSEALRVLATFPQFRKDANSALKRVKARKLKRQTDKLSPVEGPVPDPNKLPRLKN